MNSLSAIWIYCEPAAGEAVVVTSSEVGGGMTQVADSPAQFRWAISLADCDRFADMVDVVAGWEATLSPIPR